MNRFDSFCGSPAHFSRRGFLTGVTAAGSWLGLSALASKLARAEEEAPKGAPAKSVIVLWLQGGPSQLETFDPHPGSKIGGPTKAIETSVKRVKLAEGFERVAELADRLAIVRSVTSKEGDHERATYNVKTGFRPDPTLVHPAIGAVVCHELADDLDVPRYISILPGQWPGRGGYLGDQFDAFQIGDPVGRIPDLQSPVADERFQRRVEALQSIVEPTFAQRRLKGIDENKTLHLKSVRSALKMMSSEHLAAFDATTAPEALRESYGDTAFGRGCLTAVRLIERGVRCVEVELGGWDTHVNNFESVKANLKTLDQAYAALIRDLEDKDLLKHTIVVCMGEFGRTPRINPTDGRDHWPHGFSLALAGGGIRGGIVHGETAADPKLAEDKPLDDVSDPVTVEDIHATMLSCLGVEFEKELMTPIKRPMIISQGKVIERLIEA